MVKNVESSSFGDRVVCLAGIAAEVALYATCIAKRVANIAFNIIKILICVISFDWEGLKKAVKELGKNIVHLIFNDILFGAVCLIRNIAYRIFATFAFGHLAGSARLANLNFGVSLETIFKGESPSIPKDVWFEQLDIDYSKNLRWDLKAFRLDNEDA